MRPERIQRKYFIFSGFYDFSDLPLFLLTAKSQRKEIKAILGGSEDLDSLLFTTKTPSHQDT
jgi:hypothetical protein